MEGAASAIAPSCLIWPLFIANDRAAMQDLSPALPNQWAVGVARLERFLARLVHAGLSSVLLFGHGVPRDRQGTGADSPTDSPVVQAIRLLKEKFPSLVVIADVCLCAYTDTGCCGIVQTPEENASGESQPSEPSDFSTAKEDNSSIQPSNSSTFRINSAATLKRLAQIAVAYAEAGADVIAPSDMQDCTVQECKRALFAAGLGERTALMSYSAKFCSCLYGPFRAVQSASLGSTTNGEEPMGKSHSYSLNATAMEYAPSNANEERFNAPHCLNALLASRATAQLPIGAMGLAMRALQRDIEQGADILMIKPACFYADVVREAKTSFPAYPIAAFQTAGEYAMIHWAAENGAFDREQAVRESIKSLLRAGASVVVSYWVPQLLLGHHWGQEIGASERI